MNSREASCRCGALKAFCSGEPLRISVCHCLDCQKRTGSVFATQARWLKSQVNVNGTYRSWERVADSGNKATYKFCPICGSTIAYEIEGWPGVIAIPVGAFADPEFPSPKFSVYEHRRHSWAKIAGEYIEHSSSSSKVRNPGKALSHSAKKRAPEVQ